MTTIIGMGVKTAGKEMDVRKLFNNAETLKIHHLYINIAKSITSSLEVNKVIEAIMEQIERFFCPKNWSLLRLDPVTQELYFVIAKGIDPDLVSSIRIKTGEGIAGYVAQSGKSVFIENTEKDERFSQKTDELTGFKTTSLIAVPIIFNNKILGIIEIINPINKNSFTTQELEILETIADFSAIALENGITHEKMAWISIHDALTKTYNREKFDNLIQTCHLPANNEEHGGEHVITIGVDVNNFKDINDTYGHLIGDQVLLQTAKILQSYCRRNDYVFRVGGDEFVVVIMDLHKNDIDPVLHRIKKKIRKDSQSLDYNCSFSYGIVSGLKIDLPLLIKLADESMYANKASRLKRD